MTTVPFFGRLTKDATAKQLDNGKTVINFTVAMNNNYTDKSGTKKQQVSYYECAYWKEEAKILPYLKKGVDVLVNGWLFPDSYVNKDGNAVGVLRATVGTVKLFGNNKSADTTTGSKNRQTGNKNAKNNTGNEPAKDDMPF